MNRCRPGAPSLRQARCAYLLPAALALMVRLPGASADLVMAKGGRQELRAEGEFMDPAGQIALEIPAEMILPTKRQAELTRALAAWERGLAVERLERQALALQETLHQALASAELLASLEYALRALVEAGAPWANVQRASGLLMAGLGRLQNEEHWTPEQIQAFGRRVRTLILAKFPPTGSVPLSELYALSPDRVTPPLQGALAPLARVPAEHRPAVARTIRQIADAPSDETATAIYDRFERAVAAWQQAGLVPADVAETLRISARTVGAIGHLRRAAEAGFAATLEAAQRDYPEYRPLLQAVAEQAHPEAPAEAVIVPTQSADVTLLVRWVSSNPDAVIMEGNRAVLVGEGRSGISAGLGFINSLPEQAVVQPPSLLRIEVTPSQASIEQGRSCALQAHGLYSDQEARPVPTGVTWASRASAIASVDSDGTVRGLRLGETEITAQSGRFTSAPARVRVFYPVWKRVLQWLLAFLALLAALWAVVYARHRAAERRLAALRRHDPRRFITVVYHVLARQWGWIGLPRKLSTIPEEYEQFLSVTFGSTALAFLHTVTDLFLHAHYSRSPIAAAQTLQMAQAYEGLTAEVCGRLPLWQRCWLWVRGGLLRLGGEG